MELSVKLELLFKFLKFKLVQQVQKLTKLDKRYRIDTVHAKSLDGNPLNSPADRELRVYLPPGYYESGQKRYPVIYYLHGYGGNKYNWTLTSRKELDRSEALLLQFLPRKLAKQADMKKATLFYEQLDGLITNQELPSFILVQPDGSLEIPQKGGGKMLNGFPSMKGSFFVNTPHAGNYMDYLTKDVVQYIDTNYRTISDPQHRALMGGSMGGYGTLYVAAQHPEMFIAAAALSPGNFTIEMVDWKLIMPYAEMLLGREIAEKDGKAEMDDILNTIDLLFSKETPLLSSIMRDETGKRISANLEAVKNWEKYDLNTILKINPDAFKRVHLYLYCEQNDDFGLEPETRRIHETLLTAGCVHEFEIGRDPMTRLSPHVAGIAYHILPGIRFCLKHFQTPG